MHKEGISKMYLDLNKTKKKTIIGVMTALMCVAMIPLISMADGGEPATLATDLAFYAGAFSTAVTASVNPTATIAVLSIL